MLAAFRRVVSEVKTEPSAAAARDLRRRLARLPAAPPHCPAELLDKVGADVLAKVERWWASRKRELGPCLVWREGEPTIQAAGGLYGRIYDPAIKRSDAAHLVVWRRVYGPLPRGPDGEPLEVDHTCDVTLCQRPDHLRLLTKGDNVKRRGPTRGPNKRDPDAEIRPKVGNSTAQSFAIALFASVDRPTVQPQTVSFDELAELLGRFDILADKRRGRCWSPTQYADGATSRANDGVHSVSCLVFDCDRVPPDPERLAGVCWIGHTTWSHRPDKPKWRVVIPLACAVPASNWADVWQRARAALCPEGDPQCKDRSRQYYLPSHPRDAAHESTVHTGPLLDPTTLPELPRAPRPQKLRRVRVSGDRRRGEPYMTKVVDELAKTPPGGRNGALNHAAWTLGRWIAAGALGQADVEDALYVAALHNRLVHDDGQRQTWATIRSGLGAGLQQPKDLDADRR